MSGFHLCWKWRERLHLWLGVQEDQGAPNEINKPAPLIPPLLAKSCPAAFLGGQLPFVPYHLSAGKGYGLAVDSPVFFCLPDLEGVKASRLDFSESEFT